MNKRFQNYLIGWAAVLLVFNLICFITPSSFAGLYKFSGAFWAGYFGITAAFIGNLLCAERAFREEDASGLFLNVPVIRISYIGLFVMLVLGTALMMIPDVPNWAGAIVCLLVLLFTFLAVVKASATAEEVTPVERKVAEKTSFIRSLTVEAKALLDKETDSEKKELLRKLYETVRYSDPMSAEGLVSVEREITEAFGALKAVLSDGDAEKVKAAVEKAEGLLRERSVKCKGMK